MKTRLETPRISAAARPARHSALHRLRNLLAKLPERERERVRRTYWQALDDATNERDGKQRLQGLVDELDRAGCRHPCAAVDVVAMLVSVTDAGRSDDRPVLVAYDGSDEAVAALRAAVVLFPLRALIVVSVWEPGLATAMASLSGAAGPGAPSSEVVAGINRVERDLAAETADAGASLARKLGATAEAIAIIDSADVAAAITSEADRHDVCAISVGSRGLGRVKAPLLGSTSHALLRHTRHPVLVVRAPE